LIFFSRKEKKILTMKKTKIIFAGLIKPATEQPDNGGRNQKHGFLKKEEGDEQHH